MSELLDRINHPNDIKNINPEDYKEYKFKNANEDFYACIWISKNKKGIYIVGIISLLFFTPT